MESEAQGLSRKKPVILPPRGVVNMLRVTWREAKGGLLLSSSQLSANGSRRCAKARPLPRNNDGAAIKAAAQSSELRITQETAKTTSVSFPHHHCSPSRFTATFSRRAWIITMTLEEIRGQDGAMENADR